MKTLTVGAPCSSRLYVYAGILCVSLQCPVGLDSEIRCENAFRPIHSLLFFYKAKGLMMESCVEYLVHVPRAPAVLEKLLIVYFHSEKNLL